MGKEDFWCSSVPLGTWPELPAPVVTNRVPDLEGPATSKQRTP